MANITKEDDLRDYEERKANNGNRLNCMPEKSQKQLIEESEKEAEYHFNNLKRFVRK